MLKAPPSGSKMQAGWRTSDHVAVSGKSRLSGGSGLHLHCEAALSEQTSAVAWSHSRSTRRYFL